MPLQGAYQTLSNRAVLGLFYEVLDEGKGFVDSLAMRFNSDQASETYAGLTNIPAFREWIGGKEPKQLMERSMVVTNKDWESSIIVSNKDLRREKTGQLKIRLGQLASNFRRHTDTIISTMIQAGSATTYGVFADNLSYFNDAHVYGAFTNDNNYATSSIAAMPTGGTGTHGTAASPSAAEMALCILEGIQRFYAFVDSEGNPINQDAKSFTVMVPVSLYSAAAQAVNLSGFALGLVNPLLSMGLKINLVCNPRLTTASVFYIFINDSILKPFIFQVEVDPILKVLGEGSDFEFQNGAQLLSMEWAGNIGYGMPDQAIKVTITA